MWDNVHISWEEAWTDHLDHCQIDPGFPSFNEFCRKNNFPVTVLSSGLYPVLERIMFNFLGEKSKDIKIVCNNAEIKDRTWKIIWRDDSEYGNDKSKSKFSNFDSTFINIFLALIEARQNAPKDTIFIFCGDGVSDISAARHADVLFARKGRDLEIYCQRENIPFIAFDTFAEIEQVVRDLAQGKSKLEKSDTGFCKIIHA
ncbi:hypothetical protein RMATCC62417_04186 [Rhizopus microsporus]|nr:hypothetical protein RMATCC62417_04186 [Rhizopus microsporus]